MTNPQTPDPAMDPRLLLTAIESAANAIFITGVDGTIQWANPAFERLTGYSVAEAVGKTPNLLKSGRQDATFYRDLWRTVLSGEAWHGRVANRHKSGRLYTAEQTIT
ncbi:MAG: PAS domain-containing protein [Acidobacteriota bacterium]|nr:PAS domain-containing protein [Acidobacteriota bacterium]